MAGPIAGLKVVDCSDGAAGLRCTGLLADFGADVVWVEGRGGDPLRTQAPAAVSVFGRGKRSVVANLCADAERNRVLSLVDRADLFVESWRPGGAAERGLDFESLRRRNPRLVYCSISGFGEEGPLASEPGHEAIVQALVGTMAEQQGLRDGPIFQGLPFAAIGASYLAAIGSLAAVHRRNEDGLGRHVKTSLLDGALAYRSMLWGESDASGELIAAIAARGEDTRQTTNAMRLITRSFECADGEFLGIHTGAVGAFGRFMKVLGLDHRIQSSDTGMDMGMPLTALEAAIVSEEIPRILATKPREAWVELLLEADVCAVEHLHPTEVYDTPQAKHNGMVVVVDDPVLGPVQQVAPPIRFSRTPPSDVIRPAPRVGQHSEAVLGSRGGWAPRPDRKSTPDARALLADLRILDLGAYYAGPYSSRLLADLGADVIKLEPILGDPLRGIERPFYSAQAGKRAIAANLKDPRLAKALRGLLEWADVVHHNLRPGAAERLGIDYETVAKISPNIIYLYAPGWGSSGPFSMRQSFAPMLSGYAGVTYEVAGQCNPPLPPIANEDPGNGLLGAAGILMALLHRQESGHGQYLENPQLNATMAHLAHVVRRPNGEVIGAGLLDPLQLGISPYERLYETADGWVCVSAVSDEDRAALCEFTRVDATGDDAAVASAMIDAFAARGTTEVVEGLRSAGVAVAVPVGRNNHDFMNDPENRRSGRVAELPHPEKGNVRELDQLLHVSNVEAPPHRLAPEQGEHSDEILSWLGYSDGEIAELRTANVIR